MDGTEAAVVAAAMLTGMAALGLSLLIVFPWSLLLSVPGALIFLWGALQLI